MNPRYNLHDSKPFVDKLMYDVWLYCSEYTHAISKDHMAKLCEVILVSETIGLWWTSRIPFEES